jgi:hypothetical protein
VSSFSLAASAQGLEPLNPPSLPTSTTYPRVGGHLGFALPIFTLSRNSGVIFNDFVNIGVTPGITVRLDDHWSVDFEFIAINSLKNMPAGVGAVIDPGVLYNFGDFTLGLRVAAKVVEPTNIGIVPIVVYPFKNTGMGPFTPFVEGDVPIFLQDGRVDGVDRPGLVPSIGLQFQAGVSF